MSKLEIMAEMPRLTAQDRAEILGRLWLLEEAAGPTETERTALEEAQAAYEADPAAAFSWADVEARMRGRA